MPLVVPGINNKASSTDPKEEWMNKLAGKKLSDSTTDSTTPAGPTGSHLVLSSNTNLVWRRLIKNFARRDLPKEHRVVEEGSMLTQDFNQDRMNIHVGKDGTVKNVDFK